MSERVHSFDPLVGERAVVLVLGSMPGVRSLELAEYYGHPQNAFWRVAAELGVDRELPYAERCRALTGLGIAVWDVAQSCVRPGSLDTNIRAAEPNDLAELVGSHEELTTVLANGVKARELLDRFRRRGDERVALPARVEVRTMPSTSPANTRKGKVEEWVRPLRSLLP